MFIVLLYSHLSSLLRLEKFIVELTSHYEEMMINEWEFFELWFFSIAEHWNNRE